MKEIKDILQSFEEACKAGKKTALATVVHVQGSSYRRPGARMLITEQGELTGAISGGCLEGDALRKALLAINQQQNKLVTYNSMDEEDGSIGIQLGCNGIVHILFEPVDITNPNNPVALLQQAAAAGQPGILVTLFNLYDAKLQQPGTCLLQCNGKHTGSIANHLPTALLQQDIDMVQNTGQSIIKNYHSINAFIELVPPAIELVIAGAGNDAFPLLQMAAVLGWQVTVVDGRKTHANPQRFGQAHRIVVAKPAEAIPQLHITPQTVFVLMSHNYNYDLAMLQQLIHTPTRYIGVLGPQKKLQKMLTELQQQGTSISKADGQKIYGPVGLHIGAETAEEIALSVAAEIKAVLCNAGGGPLKHKPGFIHDHALNIINS
jgi:xanthine dehydrogenase accessory factor